MTRSASVFGETAFGQIAYVLSGRRLFKSVDETKDFVLPEKYLRPTSSTPAIQVATHTASSSASVSSRIDRVDENTPDVPTGQPSSATSITSIQDKDNNVIVVDWWDENDPENPQNWSTIYKIHISLIVCLMTTFVYMGSSIIAPALPALTDQFSCSQPVAALGVAVFVWGYGLGPLFLSPISEVSIIGRNWPYIVSIGLYVLLQIPTALVDDLGPFLVLRFLAGFMGSPVLATGGATMGDIWDRDHFSCGLAAWGLAATAGPVVGPLIGGYAYQQRGWRWTIWPNLIAAGAVWVYMLFFLPETAPYNILTRRARRLRRTTGNPNLFSQGEIDDSRTSIKDLAKETLYRPWIMTILEPVVFFNNLYIATVYGVLYSFFEVYPLVFEGRHGFTPGQTGLTYIAILIGAAIANICYCRWNLTWLNPRFHAGKSTPEDRQIPVMVGGAALPICLFWFGWTAFSSIHWIVPVLGTLLYGVAIHMLFQGILSYLAENYPRYIASVFASNDIMRSSIAGAFPLFSSLMFQKLTIQGGCSLLGGFSLILLPLPFILSKYGPKLRAKSKLAGETDRT